MQKIMSIRSVASIAGFAMAAGSAMAQCGAPQELIAGDPAVNVFTGSAVAISGNTALLGAPGKNPGGEASAGEVYEFSPFSGQWGQSNHFFANDGLANDSFGSSVGFSGSAGHAIVGALGVSSNRGAVYFFNYNSGTFQWGQVNKVNDPANAANDKFGWSVGMSSDGQYAIAGAPNILIGGIAGEGSAWVYRWTGAGWSQDVQLFQTFASSRHTNDGYGLAVAIDGGVAVCGCPGGDAFNAQNTGYVDIFRRAANGTWNTELEYFTNDYAAGDAVGSSVAISGNYVVCGAPNATIGGLAGAGAAYIQHFNGTNWQIDGKIWATDGVPNAHFGAKVAINGTRIVVTGTGDNRAWVFKRVGPLNWVQDQRFTSPGASNQAFGADAAISGTNVIVGDWGFNTPNFSNAGAAYIYSTASMGSDSCEGATPVTAGSHSTCTWYATVDGISTCGTGNPSGPDVWFSYTAPCTGNVTFNTSGSTFDTVLSVHSGCSGSSINTLACNDDVSFPSNTTSTITMHVNAGTAYYIRVAGYNATKGDVVLNVGSCHTCPADFNQNGTLEVQDIFDFLGAWFAGSPSANFNGGALTVQDIFDFLASWFGGC